MKRSWAATILAFFMALIGIELALGGAWLLILGGSPYYLIAGLALLASGWFLLKGRLLGGWIYIGLFILSAIWGFAESRGNAWAMIPWLVAPLVILILVLLVMPTLTRAANRWKLAGGGIALGVLLVAVELRDPGGERRHCRTRASGAERAWDDRSVGSVDRCGLARLWRHQRRLALLASDLDQRVQCR